MDLDLGSVAVTAVVSVAVDVPAPGSLRSPYPASATATRSIAFAAAHYVDGEPFPITGPIDAPSVWFEVTESEAADWLGATSGFTHGATIEIYSGPHYATGADDVTFIATDGVTLVDLGAVSMTATPVVAITSLRVKPVNLGEVVVSCSVLLEEILT